MCENLKTNSEAIFGDTEMINIWIGTLLYRNAKRFVSELSIGTIKSEIEEVKGALENEKIWALSDPIHEGNVVTLNMYIEKLYSILDANVKHESINAQTISRAIEWANDYASKLPEWYGKELISELTDDEIQNAIESNKNEIKEMDYADAEYLESLRIYGNILDKIMEERKNGGN